jgi:hypothetical protein
MGLAEIKNQLFSANGSEADKNKKMLMIMPVLFLVLIFVVTRALKKPAATEAAVGASAANIAEANFVNVSWPIPDVYPANLRDPMQAGSSASGEDKTGNVVVKGIIYSKDRPAILVDDTIARVGDKVAGATIVKINKDSVEFKMDDKTWTQEVQQ